MRYGMIAGNGRFPLLALESARQLGFEIVAIALQEEAPKEIEALAARTYWVSIGQLGKFIPTAGGLYTFAAHGLGPITGFFVGWLYVGFSLFLPPVNRASSLRGSAEKTIFAKSSCAPWVIVLFIRCRMR